LSDLLELLGAPLEGHPVGGGHRSLGGTKLTVGQRVIPLVRMNSATAASYSALDISR